MLSPGCHRLRQLGGSVRGFASKSEQAHEVVIALGSNQGSRFGHLLQAIKSLGTAGVQVLRHSLLYETAPAYVADQPRFLNAAILCSTELQPLQLLTLLKELEQAAGRNLCGQRYGPRPLDMDIIFYGAGAFNDPKLNVPHSEWQRRTFVQAPVADLLQPTDLTRGYITQVAPGSSVVHHLSHAQRLWEAFCHAARPTPTSPATPSSSSAYSRPASAAARHLLPHDMSRVMSAGPATLCWGSRSYVMGVLNVTPDSFSDGGVNNEITQAMSAAVAMADAGADIIDVGGQSTRPGAVLVGPQEEAQRVIPVIRALRTLPALSTVPLSIDTFWSHVALEAVAAGANIVNDVYGGTHDPDMLRQVADLGVPYIIMHMRGDPSTMSQPPHTSYSCLWREVAGELQQRAQAAVAAGVATWNLVLDPGLGFAKTGAANVELLRDLPQLTHQGLTGVWGRVPLLLGPSRKRFLGQLTGRQACQRDDATAAAAAVGVWGGADILRAHNVGAVRDACRVADAVWRGPHTWPADMRVGA